MLGAVHALSDVPLPTLAQDLQAAPFPLEDSATPERTAVPLVMLQPLSPLFRVLSLSQIY